MYKVLVGMVLHDLYKLYHPLAKLMGILLFNKYRDKENYTLFND